MRVNNENMLEVDGVAAPMNLGASVNSKPLWLGHIMNFAIQLAFSGTPGGTFKLQYSNDKGHPNAQSEAQQYANVTHWTDDASSVFTIAAAGDVMWDVRMTGPEWVRVVWTRTSGTGTVDSARFKCKGA